MKMKTIEINNTKTSNYLYYLILTYLIVFMILPALILTNLENSLVAMFLNNNLYILFLIYLVFIYIFIIGVYYCYLKVDSYIINISSSRFNTKNNLLDIKHDMLDNFFFKISILSWNTTLYLNFKKDEIKQSVTKVDLCNYQKLLRHDALGCMLNIMRDGEIELAQKIWSDEGSFSVVDEVFQMSSLRDLKYFTLLIALKLMLLPVIGKALSPIFLRQLSKVRL